MLAGGRGCAGSRQAGQIDRTADGEGGEEQRGATGLDVTSSSRQSFSQAILARRWSIIVLSVELCRALPCHFQLSMRCRPSRLPSLPPLAEGKASRQLESADRPTAPLLPVGCSKPCRNPATSSQSSVCTERLGGALEVMEIGTLRQG